MFECCYILFIFVIKLLRSKKISPLSVFSLPVKQSFFSFCDNSINYEHAVPS